MKANGSRREETGGEKISRKKSGASPGRERKTVGCVGEGIGGVKGGGCWRSMRGAGVGPATRARTCPLAAAAGGCLGAGGHTPSGNVARRSSSTPPSAASVRAASPPLLPRTPARAARHNTRARHFTCPKCCQCYRPREFTRSRFTYRTRPAQRSGLVNQLTVRDNRIVTKHRGCRL